MQNIGWLLFINILSFAMFGIDKYKAVHNQWRISEKALLTIATLGGSVGAYIGMHFFHHKTLHWKFRIGVPLLFILQVALGIYWSWK